MSPEGGTSADAATPAPEDPGLLGRLLDHVLPSELSGPLPEDPIPTLVTWFGEATSSGAYADPNAMTLATATPDGAPSARVVLCKQIDASPPALLFFTNYQSRKGRELEVNPRAAAVFHWPHAGRQARIEGDVVLVGGEECDAYFASRPLLSRLGAVASRQSEPIASRAELIRAVATAGRRSFIHGSIPRPTWWGGYRLRIRSLELWASSAGRLHDRAAWHRVEENPVRWSVQRLSP